MSESLVPPPPSTLSAIAKRWWRKITADWEAFEEHHLLLLEQALLSFDQAERARKVLKKEGLTFLDRFEQPKARPEAQIETSNRAQFRLLLRELGLDLETGSPEDDDRPPRLGSGKRE